MKEYSKGHKNLLFTAIFQGGEENTVDQTNTQSIRDVTDGSLSQSTDDNIAANNVFFGASFDDSSFIVSDSNSINQNNEQNIEHIKKGSEADNTGFNTALFVGSDANTVDQSNEQKIKDVKEGSSTENDAENNADLNDADKQ